MRTAQPILTDSDLSKPEPAKTSNGLVPLTRDSLSDMAYNQIRAALMSSRLRPGQKLVLRALAAELHISPTPVREALLRLVSEFALELDPRGIVRVPVIDLATYLEVRDLRIELEGRAAAAAALLATDEDIADLMQTHDRFLAAERAGDARAAGEANEDLHRKIYSLARMPVLLSLIENLRVRCGPVLASLFDPECTRDGDPNRHAMIIDGLRTHDPMIARMGVEADIMAGWRTIAKRLT